MFNRLKKLFGQKPPSLPEVYDEVAAREWYEHKSLIMEKTMGKQHNIVMHAIIPYAVGGGLDLYYYPNGILGTGIATMELSELPNKGSSNSVFSCYELVMFTKVPLMLDDAKKPETAFGKAHSNLNSILNVAAPFSATAKLNPHDTCEFPADMRTVGGKCLIFDDYGQFGKNPPTDFGILVAIEIFRSEMDFARKIGGEQLIQLLKEAGHYPYSDLEREPVA
jgi:hypothetical protein